MSRECKGSHYVSIQMKEYVSYVSYVTWSGKGLKMEIMAKLSK